MLNVTTRGRMPSGVWIQPYLDDIPGKTHAAKMSSLGAQLARWKQLGVIGVAFHGFTTSLPAQLPELIGPAKSNGLLSAAAFGLDATDPIGKGERLGRAAVIPGLSCVGLDAEGAYDQNAQNIAASMLRVYRDAAPDMLTFTQPWPLPQYHSHFPYIEFASQTDVVAPQMYYNDWKSQHGGARYREMGPKFESAWRDLEAHVFAPRQLVRPRILTVQTYGWSDIKYDCVDCVVRNETIIGWGEPYPEQEFLGALSIRQRLDQRVGLYVNGQWNGSTAVLRFQQHYNSQMPPSAQLLEDGKYGAKTDAALMGGVVTRMVRSVGQILGLAA